MKILVACEESQAVTKELRALGHEAFSCDVQEASGGFPEWHIKGDVLPLLDGYCSFETSDGEIHNICCEWDMIIAFPPCTHLAVSGAAHFEKKRKDGRQKEAIDFFYKFVNAKCKKIAIENPIGIISGNYVKKFFDTEPLKPSQIIQPWQFGDNVGKSTCLWLKGLPLLMSEITERPDTEYHTWIDKNGKEKRMEKWFYETRCLPYKDRGRMASKTFPGIAKAMATQWTKE